MPPTAGNSKMLWQVIKAVIPLSLLIVIVLGSIFAGMATTTEASGMSAARAMLLAAMNHRLSWRAVKEVVYGTFRISGFIFCIWIAATLFALVMRLLGGDELIGGRWKRFLSGPRE